MFITTKVTTNVILGQLADLSDEPSDLESEMTKFLHFRATVTLGNDKVRKTATVYIQSTTVMELGQL